MMKMLITHESSRAFPERGITLRDRFLVAQALLPVPASHSQEWLCHRTRFVNW